MEKPRISLEEIEAAIGSLDNYRHRCHAASLALVRSGLVKGRVARGLCLPWVQGQHSWVVLANDCYSPSAQVVDLTLWSYHPKFPRVYVVRNLAKHVPHGFGNWKLAHRLPRYNGGPIIRTKQPLSVAATDFIQKFSTNGLDVRGWAALANLPVLGWPAREIISAMLDTPQLSALVPIDIAGMLTDRNPQGLYLREVA